MSDFDTIDAYISEGNVTIEANMMDGNTIIEVNLSNSSTYGFSPIAPRKAINFYDYDGTIFASWTLAELANATALPTNPSHKGLIAQGWNWTLSQLKTENRAMDVGQMYITDDGKTRLYITIAALGRMTVPLYWSQTVASGVTIDWGDGSAPETFTGTGNKNTTHVYAAIGDYIITLEVTAGILGLGSGSAANCVLGTTGVAGRVYTNMLQKAEIGSSVTSIGNYAFYTCYSLASVVIPSSMTSIGTSAFHTCYSLASVVIPSSMTSISTGVFQNCYSLASVVIPNSVTSMGTDVFHTCYSLASVVIPSSMTSIGANVFALCYSLASVVIPSSMTSISTGVFQNCYSLASAIIPNSVTSIGTSAFHTCSGMAEYHFQRATPPTLANIDAFTGIPADCKIYVPLASLAAYQAATNWSTYAAKMVGE